jgi:hypothetical protein
VIFRGEWDAETDYALGELVRHEDGLWIARGDVAIGDEPGGLVVIDPGVEGTPPPPDMNGRPSEGYLVPTADDQMINVGNGPDVAGSTYPSKVLVFHKPTSVGKGFRIAYGGGIAGQPVSPSPSLWRIVNPGDPATLYASISLTQGGAYQSFDINHSGTFFLVLPRPSGPSDRTFHVRLAPDGGVSEPAEIVEEVPPTYGTDPTSWELVLDGAGGDVATWRSGAGDPAELGVDGNAGDFFLDTLNGRIFGPLLVDTEGDDWPTTWLDLVGEPGASGAAPYVTALPTEPEEDDEIVVEVAAGVAWRLRYHDGDWLFLGGPPLRDEVMTSQATASAAYAALATSGPNITVPFAGDYDVLIGGRLVSNPNNAAYMSYAVGATAASDDDAVEMGFNASTLGATMSMTRRKTGLAAGTVLSARYRAFAAPGPATFSKRFMEIRPVRLG